MNNKSFYTASLTNVPEGEKNFLKSKSCILAISVGQPYHEEREFRATLKMVNNRFKSCFIAVADTLQHHNFNISDKTNAEVYDFSLPLRHQWVRHQWINRNEQMISEELKIPYKILRWEHWINSKFTEDLKKVKKLYIENESYKSEVHEVVNGFLARHKKNTSGFCLEKDFQSLLEYLLEECACTLQWFDEGCDYVVYPLLRNKAIATTFSLIEPEKTKLLLRSVAIKFKKYADQKQHSDFNQLLLDDIVSASPGHVYWKNKHGTLQGCNLSHAKSFGFSDIESVIGKTEFDALDYNEALEIRKTDLKIMRSGKTLIVEEKTKVGDKSIIYISHKSPIKNSDGSVVGILGVSIDITKQKEFEQQLRENEEQLEKENRELKKKNEELQQALDVRKEFLRNVSHEIRTPLSCILNMSNLLYNDWDRYSDNDTRKSHLKIAVDNNNRLEKVLTNLLDLSKVEGGMMKYEKENYSLKKSTLDVVNEFARHKDMIKIELQGKGDFEAIYDSLRIEQVIRNLLANAINYGGPGDITIKLAHDNNSLVFGITDQGVGIPEDELESIFNIFTQSSRTKTGAGGTGIGLSICRNIIRGHDGKIWAENNKEGGSTFWFRIPAA